MLKKHKIHEGQGIKSTIVIDSNVIIDTFDRNSPHHGPSMDFMEYIVGHNILFAMPMHGWFELNCTLNRLRKQGTISLPTIAGSQAMPIEFIHIDAKFLENYGEVEVPVIKAMDHLFLVVAKKNNLPLVTWDIQMTTAAKECGVHVSNPIEWLQEKKYGQPDN